MLLDCSGWRWITFIPPTIARVDLFSRQVTSDVLAQVSFLHINASALYAASSGTEV